MDLASFAAKRGLNVTQLANFLGRPISTVHGWLSGARRPDWASIEDIARKTAGAVTANDFQDAPKRDRGLAESQAAFATEARALGLDPDAIAATALRKAIAHERARRWQEENREAIEAWNRYFEENDTPLAKYRMF